MKINLKNCVGNLLIFQPFNKRISSTLYQGFIPSKSYSKSTKQVNPSTIDVPISEEFSSSIAKEKTLNEETHPSTDKVVFEDCKPDKPSLSQDNFPKPFLNKQEETPNCYFTSKTGSTRTISPLNTFYLNWREASFKKFNTCLNDTLQKISFCARDNFSSSCSFEKIKRLLVALFKALESCKISL